MTLFIVGVSIALVISALCSVMEATLLSLTPAQVADLRQSRPRLGAIWHQFKEDVERPIAVILLLNTAAHTVGASVAGAQFGKVFGEEHLWLFAGVFTFVMLQFTEILAKTLGVRFNRTLATVIARPLQWSAVALQPVLFVIRLINKPFESKGRARERPATVEEITALAGLARLSQEISGHQERIITAAPRMSEIPVTAIMIPRDEIAFLSTDQSLAEAIDYARTTFHTRFPVVRERELDQLVGYINIKEILFHRAKEGEGGSLDRLVRPLPAVTPDVSAAELLRRFIRDRIHLAVVRDEAGRTIGLVALEDIVEELLGDIRDEFDRLPHSLIEIGDGRWLAGGGIKMAELAAEVGVELTPEEKDQSLAGWLAQRFTQPLSRGSVFEKDGLTVTVRRLHRGSAYECELERTT